MNLRGPVARGAVLLAAAAFAPVLFAQIPPALASLQSGFMNTSPTNSAAITAGTPITAFTLYINGTFHPSTASISPIWTSAVHGTITLQPINITSTLVTAIVPAGLFNVADIASVAVAETTLSPSPVVRTSNPLTFTVNPPLSLPSTGSTLPIATVGSPYSANFYVGGTGPIAVGMETTPPPGMPVPSNGNPFAGTPNLAGIYSVEFLISDSWNNDADLIETFAAFSPATLTSISPNQALLGSSAQNLTLTGTQFVSTRNIVNAPVGSTAIWGTGNAAVSLATTFVDSSHLTAIVPANLLTTVGSTPISVLQPGGSLSNSLPFRVFSPSVQIQVPGGLTATVSTPYDLPLSASGGTLPYLWNATGLPAGLAINRTTGDISGIPSQTGSFPVSVTVVDGAVGTFQASATARFTISVVNAPQPPLQITGATLPAGTVGQPYSYVISANGGSGNPYTFTIATGSLPAGLTLGTGGGIFGTPTTPGSSTFTVQVADTSTNTATASFTLAINPPTLAITTGALAPVAAGSPVNIKFAATGGVPPYTFSLGGTTAPAGTQFASDGSLSGTVATTGAYTFRVTVTDSAKNSATQSFTLTVNTPALTVTATSLPPATAGSPYSTSLAATGGTPPYTWTVTGLPAGLSASAAGAITGTPTAAATASVSLTVTDSAGAHATATLPLTVAPAALVITTSSLPGATIGSAYSTSLAATGGSPPYTWIVTGLPNGLSSSASGSISGTPTASGSSTLSVTVTDSAATSALTTLTLVVAAAPLSITTASLSNASVGAAYSATVAATGGTSPYTFSATGLPAGLSIAASGAISGTPTTAGAATVAISVKDSAGVTASKSLALSVALPTLPPVSFPGAPSTSPASTQNSLQIGLASTFPVDVTGKLTLVFTPTSGADDPAVQFATGGRTAQLTVPAGATLSSAKLGVQSGTVAGTITITAQLLAGAEDVTPLPAPKQTITIPAGAPVITSVTATRNSTGFTVTVVGYATTRSVTQATFQFTAASGSSLQTTSATIPSDSLFTAWFGSAAAGPFGGQFTLTQPFTVSGSPQTVASVSVTLANAISASSAVSATLQ